MFDKLIDVLINFVDLFKFFVVIRVFEGGVVLRFGKFHRMAPPGLRWKWPFNIEEVFYANIVATTRVIGPQSLTTRDGYAVIVSSVITYEVEDVKKFLLEVSHGHAALEDSTYAVVADMVMSSNWEELMSVDLARKMEIAVRRQAKKWGVNVRQLQLADFTRSTSLRLIQSHVEQPV